MTTIGLSTGTEPIPSQPKPVDWKKRIASIWIPVILALGLLTTFAYVGVRIVSGRPTVQTISERPPVQTTKTPPNIEVQVTVRPAPTPKSAPAPVVSAKGFTVITPLAGEQYLQIAAVSPHMVLTYVDTLRASNLDAIVAPGPTPDLLRILVGPFQDRDSMEKLRAQLVTAGRSPIVRIY